MGNGNLPREDEMSQAIAVGEWCGGGISSFYTSDWTICGGLVAPAIADNSRQGNRISRCCQTPGCHDDGCLIKRTHTCAPLIETYVYSSFFFLSPSVTLSLSFFCLHFLRKLIGSYPQPLIIIIFFSFWFSFCFRSVKTPLRQLVLTLMTS